jgi:predicted 3-demethylubiquinone-9 3-methyltransferase (glyoxalase superfamily)
MTIRTQKITPCLWFDSEAEEAARFYASIFKDSRIGKISRYSEVGQELHNKPPGSVMTVELEIAGQRFTALNGGPIFKFNEAISFQIDCATQDEIDYFWERLSEGGVRQQCGWLKDKFGVSWQIVPQELGALIASEESAGAKRAMAALFQMQKPDIARLKAAYAQS